MIESEGFPMTSLWKEALVLGAAILLVGCSGSQTNGDATQADSAGGPSLAADTTETNPPPAPPPGTARIRGVVLSCEPGETVTCGIRVGEVLAYGPSTPPVAQGTRRVSVRPVVLKSRSVEDLADGGVKLLKLTHSGSGRTLGGETGEAKTGEWALIDVSE
jgi:hypothetical protein